MYKRYIRIDENNYIIDKYVDWQPGYEILQDDILVEETNERHWQLSLLREDGLYKYKYDNGIVEILDSEYVNELQKIAYQEEIKTLEKELDDLDYKTMRYYEQKHIIEKEGVIDNPKYLNDLSLQNGDILALFKEKQVRRNRINELEVLISNL